MGAGTSTGYATGTGTSSGTASGGEIAPPLGSGGAGGADPQPGMLTAGDWDDNLNWSFFSDYRSEFLYTHDYLASVPVDDRIVITVVNDQGEPIPNAKVTIKGSAQQVLLSAPTASDGRLLFFPVNDGATSGDPLSLTIEPPAGQSLAPLTVAVPSTNEWNLVLPQAVKVLPQALDLAFVVDSTGSMSDELEYVKVEIQGIADTIQANFGPLDVQYALIVYRDIGDLYVTKSFDFTGDLQVFKANLLAQHAAGGGDYPEAMDDALVAMNDLSWRNGNVTRVAFLIADAPPHHSDGVAVLAQADLARRSGVKIYPVAGSGVADEAEYFMRQAAELTLGRYLFLTDDSGIGNSHAEPHIPCYQVQYLNDLINRMIACALTGTRVSAEPAKIIKTVGDPDGQGVCTLTDGSTVAF